MTETIPDYRLASEDDVCATCRHGRGSHRPLGCVDCAEDELTDSDGTASVEPEHDFVLLRTVRRVQWWTATGGPHALTRESAIHLTEFGGRTLCDLAVPGPSRRTLGLSLKPDSQRKPCPRCAKRAREMGAIVAAA